jgi:CXXX repeat peptide maturase
MLQYLILLLDDTSVSYCHYENTKTGRRLISPEDLKAGILYAMKQNLMVQFVYPDYGLPETYETLIQSIDHHRIVPFNESGDEADVEVVNGRLDIPESGLSRQKGSVFVLRIKKKQLFAHYKKLAPWIKSTKRLHILITDIETFQEEDFSAYKKVLSHLQTVIREEYRQGLYPQLNLLSDRILLDQMNNCNAGTEHITLAPNGKFYICPAFYQENEADSSGDLNSGPAIGNPALYRLDHAPLCRTCDAYQCRRCVWLNRKTTLEVNTPSREQCITAHLERNAARELLMELQQADNCFPGKTIREIDYLDPFEHRSKILD